MCISREDNEIMLRFLQEFGKLKEQFVPSVLYLLSHQDTQNFSAYIFLIGQNKIG